MKGWRFWIDRGGTFTDLVARAPDGRLLVRKVLSERRGSTRDPAVAAIREVLGLAPAEPLPPGLVEEVRLGTTVATNALLERHVEPVLLLVNRGYADVSRIGEQHRPDIFALKIERPEPLPHRVLEVPGRLAADGSELEPFIADSALEAELRRAHADGLRCCAVALLHAVVNPAHELALGAWLEALGFGPVLLSHQVGGLPRLIPRLQTTLVEAAVRPVLQAYLAGVQRELGAATRLRVMTSAGILQPPASLLAKDTILSGPAGGLVGAMAVARAAGLAGRPLIGFDMGGTSTDVFHLEGEGGAAGAAEPARDDNGAGGPESPARDGLRDAAGGQPSASPGPELSPETVVDGLRLQALSLPIHTVAAGGGSLLRFEGGRLQVGPDSAGAVPGPACYCLGGPLTLTDANLLLGRLPPGSLPAVFGPDGDQPPDAAVVRQAFEALAARIGAEAPGGPSVTPELLAQGARSIALERMADAIRRISIQRGHAVGEAVLVCYGGAGGQHACALAERLGIARVLLHPLAGVLSAYGIGLSRQEALRSAAVQQPLAPELIDVLRERRDALLEEACAALRAAGDGEADRQAAGVILELRLRGGERGLEVPWPGDEGADDLRQVFEWRHRQRFGYVVAGEPLVVERLLVKVPAAAAAGADAGVSAADSAVSADSADAAPDFVASASASASASGSGSGSAATSATSAAVASVAASASDSASGSHSASAVARIAASATGLAPAADLPPFQPVPLCLPVEGRPEAAGSAAPEAGSDGTAERLTWRSVPCWRREDLRPDQELVGPAVLLEATGTTVLEPGWGGRVLADGALLLEPLRQDAPQAAAAEGEVGGGVGDTDAAGDTVQDVDTRSNGEGGHDRPLSAGSWGGEASREAAGKPGFDPVRLELYNHRFSAIAEQMGVRLQQSSRSVNIRERLDFSCALFDGSGRLVANAPHIPVHLGSMGESVMALLAAIERGERPPLRPGDAIAANDPYAGGTHLPDITVITPVFAPRFSPDSPPASPLFYVACRGHHADVGGITPGSMPPFSRSIAEEGLRLDNIPLIREGHLDADAWSRRLAEGEHPVRAPERLMADLQAQVAANRLGEAELQRLLRQRGTAEVIAAMEAVQRNAADAVRSLIDRLRPGRHAVELDDGSRIVVAVEPDPVRRRLRVDFTGTSPQQSGNLNAPLAITKAVVLYGMRVLVSRPIPLNAGCFEPIDLVVPPGSLLNPAFPAAVVGGNVETSQAVANALFGALGVLAGGQGTMNNLSFGNDRCQYYETVAGGSGAGVMPDSPLGFDGCGAVQSHMTNSRLTDPEILEARFPVRLERFALRRGSGGAGRWRGGDGVVRQLRALEPITLAILSGSRRVPPFGMDGGDPGRCGRNALLRADGRREELGGSAQVTMAAGDAFLLETPGGGGWGTSAAAGEDTGAEN